MTKFLVTLILFVLSQVSIFAQTTTVVDARTGVRDGRATYHSLNVLQVREGKWIAPDAGWIDFGRSDYRELWIGGGYRLVVDKHFFVQEELLFVQANGSASGDARYLQPFTMVVYKPTPRLVTEAVVFPYIPLNDAGRKQWVVEHAKLEYIPTPVLKVGAGYGAYQFGDEKWQNKPFIATTLTPASGKFGSFELWLQRLPNGNQIQLRYELAKHK